MNGEVRTSQEKRVWLRGTAVLLHGYHMNSSLYLRYGNTVLSHMQKGIEIRTPTPKSPYNANTSLRDDPKANLL